MWFEWADSTSVAAWQQVQTKLMSTEHSPSAQWGDPGTSNQILSKKAVIWWWGRLLHSSKYNWGSILFSSHFETQKKSRMKKKQTEKELHPEKTVCQEVKWWVSKNCNELITKNNYVLHVFQFRNICIGLSEHFKSMKVYLFEILFKTTYNHIVFDGL